MGFSGNGAARTQNGAARRGRIHVDGSVRLLGVADGRAGGAADRRPDRTGHHGPGDRAGSRLLFNAVAAGRQGQGSGAGQRQDGQTGSDAGYGSTP